MQKHIIFGRSVVFVDFEHLNLGSILSTSCLEFFVIIKEQIYPEVVQFFYSKFSFHNNIIRYHVKNVDINISLEGFAQVLHLSCEGVDIFNIDFNDFEYLDGETALIASRLLHDDDNPALMRNEEVKYFILSDQVVP